MNWDQLEAHTRESLDAAVAAKAANLAQQELIKQSTKDCECDALLQEWIGSVADKYQLEVAGAEFKYLQITWGPMPRQVYRGDGKYETPQRERRFYFEIHLPDRYPIYVGMTTAEGASHDPLYEVSKSFKYMEDLGLALIEARRVKDRTERLLAAAELEGYV